MVDKEKCICRLVHLFLLPETGIELQFIYGEEIKYSLPTASKSISLNILFHSFEQQTSPSEFTYLPRTQFLEWEFNQMCVYIVAYLFR